jgi:hypothetical protein
VASTPNMDLVDADLLRRAVGKVLRRAEAFVYVDAKNEKRADDPISLSLEFAEGVTLRMYGHSDGERLRVDSSAREPFDMHELGRVVLRDVSNSSNLQALIGRRLSAVRTLAHSVPARAGQHIAGIRFEFDPSERLYVLNWGDTTFVGRDLPADAMPSELTEVLLFPHNGQDENREAR